MDERGAGGTAGGGGGGSHTAARRQAGRKHTLISNLIPWVKNSLELHMTSPASPSRCGSCKRSAAPRGTRTWESRGSRPSAPRGRNRRVDEREAQRGQADADQQTGRRSDGRGHPTRAAKRPLKPLVKRANHRKRMCHMHIGAEQGVGLDCCSEKHTEVIKNYG